LGNNTAFGLAAFGIEPVDPYHHLAAAEAAVFQRIDNPMARLGLCVGRDSVFEIEDEAVGRQLTRLFQRARIRSGHVKHAAAWTDGHR